MRTETVLPNRARFPWLFVLFVGLVLTVVISTGMGYIRIHPMDVIRIIIGRAFRLGSLLAEIDRVHPVVVFDVRLPRILCAALVGGGLSICGCVFQGILLNPLADPYTLGVSAGAAFGASVAILLNLSHMGFYPIWIMAFLGAFGSLAFVVYLSASGGGFSSNNLILSGIIVGAILSAGISFLKYLADDQVSVIIFWLMGSFASRTWIHVGAAFLAAGFGLTVFMMKAQDLNLLVLGEKSAASLGVETRKTMLVLLIVSSLVTAVCVSISGIIGFVGLLLPHMMRAMVGPDNRLLIPTSFLAGCILLLWADTITRAVLPQEIPIGILTALIGGPFFCYIFRKRQMGKTAL